MTRVRNRIVREIFASLLSLAVPFSYMVAGPPSALVDQPVARSDDARDAGTSTQYVNRLLDGLRQMRSKTLLKPRAND